MGSSDSRMIGRTVSHYEILEEIGRGGMGVVYRARDVKLGREVAVKVLPPVIVSDPERSRRFEQEARAAATLEHPNIAVVHEIDEVDGVSFIVLEYLRAKTLREIIPEGGMPVTRAIDITQQVASALGCAHASGIVHRDIKPGNVMVTDEDRVKIIDFGLAKLIEITDSESEEETLSRLETEIGVIVGTTTYMSPEQARAEELDARTDIFSLGVVFVEMLTGKPPFTGRGAADILSSVLRDPTPQIGPQLSDINTAPASRIQAIIERCLAKKRDDRYPSASALIEDLEQARTSIVEGEGVPRWVGRAARAALVVGMAGASAVLGAWWLSSRATKAPPAANVADISAEISEVQRSVAVIGFRNLTTDEDVAWLSTALSEMMSTELATGDRLRVLSGEDVARMKAELALTAEESFARDTLERIRLNLGCDYVVVGSYLVLGEAAASTIRLDVRLQDTAVGETVQSVASSGNQDQLFDIVSESGAELRDVLGVGRLSDLEMGSLRAATSSSSEATRLYAEGLAKLRAFDANGAKDLVERSLEIDPDFALAHAALSDVWSHLGYDARAVESAERAVELSDSLPRNQQLLLRAFYQERSADWPGAVETLTVLFARSPRNLDYGLRLAAAQGAAGKSNEGIATLTALRRLPAPLSDDPRLDLMESELVFRLDDYRRAAELAREVETKARAASATTLVARALMRQGDALWNLGDLEASADSLEGAVALFEALGNPQGVAEGLNSRAILYEIQGNLSTADTIYRESLLVAREIGDRSAIATALYNLATVSSKLGALSDSARFVEESLEVVREIRDPLKEATRLTFLGRVSLEKGDLEGATRLAEDALPRQRALGAQVWESETLKLLSDIQLASGDLDAARESLSQALSVSENIGQRVNTGRHLTALGELLVHAGELDAAGEELDRGVSVLREVDELGFLARSDVTRARLLIERGRADEASDLARAAATALNQQGRRDDELLANAVLVRALLEAGKTEQARAVLERIGPAASESERPTVRLTVALENARFLASTGDADSGRAVLGAAMEEARELGLGHLVLELRLALATVAPPGDADALSRDAESHGFGLIAKKAALLARPAPPSP